MDITEKRFAELAQRAERRHFTEYTDFLNTDEQSCLLSLKLPGDQRLFGGFEGAERCICAFGSDCENSDFPINIIKIEPVNQKFAEKLTHRDFLGSLMGLGIKREVLGDILIKENIGYLFCLSSISEYIVRSLDKVRKTGVKTSVIEKLPDNAQAKPEALKAVISSERLDVIIAAAYKLSRNAVKELFCERKVFVNSRLCENFSYIPKEGDIISVRGSGRFVYGGILGKTKKSRLLAELLIYK